MTHNAVTIAADSICCTLHKDGRFPISDEYHLATAVVSKLEQLYWQEGYEVRDGRVPEVKSRRRLLARMALGRYLRTAVRADEKHRPRKWWTS